MRTKRQKIFSFLCVFFIFTFLFFIFIIGYQLIFRNRVYPRVWLGKDIFYISNKTEKEIDSLIRQFEENVSQGKIVFQAGEKEVSVSPVLVSSDPTLSRELIAFSPEQTAKQAIELGRKGNIFKRLWEQGSILIKGRQLKLDFTLDRNEFKNILISSFASLQKPALNPRLKKISGQNFAITKEEPGITLDFDAAIKELENNLASMRYQKISLKFVSVSPELTYDQAFTALDQAKDFIQKAPISVAMPKSSPETAENIQQKWSVGEETIIQWLIFKKQEQNIIIDLDGLAIAKFLEQITKEVNIEPREAMLKFSDTKVEEFIPPEAGRELNIEKTVVQAKQKLLSGDSQFFLVIEKKEPQTALSDINNLGIKEFLAEGRSNFKGSPSNRRHNIAIGVEKLNGMLIPPQEEFSLLRALGKTDASAGYLPELVIKGNRTVPEFGGGLCQIATTVFRLALNTGLPITERREHAFRVRYYEPAGMDATIYDPKPDFRFTNDTPTHLLLTARIEGNDLIFEFWGTSDARRVEISQAKIWNITAPGPTQYIETEELKEDEEKCIEKPVSGAQAEFTRTITFANQEKKEETWSSRYRPWPEVCLIGKKIEPAELQINTNNTDLVPTSASGVVP